MKRLGGSPGRFAGCTVVGRVAPASVPAPAVVLSTISDAKAGRGAVAGAVAIHARMLSVDISGVILAR